MTTKRGRSALTVDASASEHTTRRLEEENGKLKKIVADLSLDKAMLQDVIRRKF